MLPTLDESGGAIRQTGGRDPHRGIRISDAPARGPQPAGVAHSATPAVAPNPLDKGKGAASEALEDYWWGRGGQLPGPRCAEARQSSGPVATTTIWGDHPRDTSSSNIKSSRNSSSRRSGDRLASRVTGRASSPSAPKVTPPPPDTRPTDGSGSQQQESAGSGAGGAPPVGTQTAPAASHAPARDPGAVAPASGGFAAVEEVPAGGSAPTPNTGGEAGGASSSN
eukprot:XP_020397139.1 vasodilator-stimulated phosphoprotein-like [Zea mays]